MKKKDSRNIYYKHLTRENLYSSWKIVKRTCKNKKEKFIFSLNLNTNISNIYDLLYNKTYTHDGFKPFMIFEPKARLVMSESIKDKIVNHFITNYYLLPYLENKLIDNNVATRKNKGSSYANKEIKKFINKILINEKNKDIYCLKIDISKYFYNINHDILLSKLNRDLMDKDVDNLLEIIIKDTSSNYINNKINYYNKNYNLDIPNYINNKGISIGAVSSQFLAIYYLNDLDHLIKEKLKCKYYIRYMDDLVLINTDKEYLKYCYKVIEKEITKLDLKINSKSNIYKLSIGFSFLGYKYKVINNKLNIKFNTKTIYKINKKLNDYINNNDYVGLNKSKSSYYGYFKNIYKLKKGCFKMNSEEFYRLNKEKYSNYIVIVKEGIFFKTYLNDSIIIWYVFNYKFNNNSIGFSNKCYDKVISKLKDIDISFIIMDKDNILFEYNRDNEIYNSYLLLSKKSFNKEIRKNKLVDKLIELCNKNSSNYEIIDNFFDSIINN